MGSQFIALSNDVGAAQVFADKILVRQSRLIATCKRRYDGARAISNVNMFVRMPSSISLNVRCSVRSGRAAFIDGPRCGASLIFCRRISIQRDRAPSCFMAMRHRGRPRPSLGQTSQCWPLPPRPAGRSPLPRHVQHPLVRQHVTDLNRNGNRQANNALWTIVMVRIGSEPRTYGYVKKRTSEGLSNKEIHRCVHRYVVRELYPYILANLKAAAQTC